MRSFDLDRDKFDRLVHYIIWSCTDPAKLGSTKIQKILWKIDTKNYMMEARPVTGATYQKREFGPATNELWPSRERLNAAGAIEFWRDKKFASNREKDVYKSLAKPDVSFLTKEQKISVDFWINEICINHTAESASDESHGYAWDIASIGEPLPLYSVFVDDLPQEPDEEAKKWAISEANRLNLRAV